MLALGVLIGITISGALVMFVLIGMQLSKLGRVPRWQFWLMGVVFGAIVCGAIFMAIQPLTLFHVGIGAAIGAIVGAISGIFYRPPMSAEEKRLNYTQRMAMKRKGRRNGNA